MAYEGQCGSCENFKDKDNEFKPFDVRWANSEKGFCDWYRCFYWADDSCCHHKTRYVPSSCYITTVVCNILGYEDDCGVLNTLRVFRDNILQKDSEYALLLFEYDSVGPKIAESLQKDYQATGNIELATNLFNFYIQPTSELIREKKYDEAVSRYQEMTLCLEEYYGISPSSFVLEDYDREKGGHGTLKLKKLPINGN